MHVFVLGFEELAPKLLVCPALPVLAGYGLCLTSQVLQSDIIVSMNRNGEMFRLKQAFQELPN